MRYSFSIFFFLILWHFLSAQEFKPSYRNQVKFSALKLIDLSHPGVELSYERLHGKTLPEIGSLFFPAYDYSSSQFSFAYLDNLVFRENRIFPKGYRISFEEKFFLPMEKKQPLFGAFEIVYLRVRYPDVLSKRDTSGRIRMLDSVDVTKQTFSLNGKFGVQVRLKFFVIELSGGVGFKYRVIKFSEKSHPELFYEKFSKAPWGYDPRRYLEGKSFTLNLPVTLKLGFSF